MDINNDGKNDIIAGDSSGAVWMFLNTGTPEKPELAAGKKLEADGKEIAATTKTYKKEGNTYVVDKTIVGSHELSLIYSKIHVGDWDGDGLKDLLVGHDNTIVLYKNAGTPEACRFLAPVALPCPDGKAWPMRPSPCLIDLDGDGKTDLLVGSESPRVMFYRNLGTNKEIKLDKGVALPLAGDGFEKGYRIRICVADWNNDGVLDILAGNIYTSTSTDGKSRKSGGSIWLFLGKK